MFRLHGRFTTQDSMGISPAQDAGTRPVRKACRCATKC